MSDLKPMGGTELMLARLQEALPELTSQVQIICSRPLQTPLENKPRVLWLHDLPQDPAVQCLRDASYRSSFSKLVFVSHWQQQMFNAYLGIPFTEGIVIKNAVPRMQPVMPRPVAEYGGKVRFVYTSTPHRGLAILAAAAKELAKLRDDWTLDVFSSLKLYGWAEADARFQPLYDELDTIPNVYYHGTASNENVRQTLLNSHVWVYPSIYAETSCLAAIEAMMAGCLAITTNFGALPETCGEWAWMMQYTEDPTLIANQTMHAMNRAIDVIEDKGLQDVLRVQSQYYQQYYSFEQRVAPWRGLLTACIEAGTPEQMLVIE